MAYGNSPGELAEFSEINGYVDPRYTFDNFVVAANNESCVLAGKLAVDQPGEAYNPLYIHGAKGLGKTHLMYAIANALIAKGQMNIVCKSAESFVNGLIAAVRDGEIQAFRRQYQNTDVLMIDDLQFIAEKMSTREGGCKVFFEQSMHCTISKNRSYWFPIFPRPIMPNGVKVCVPASHRA